MAEIPADASVMHSEDRARLNRLRAVPDIGEGHLHANPQLKSILDELARHPKPDVDDGPDAA
jgi:hypothetical protein